MYREQSAHPTSSHASHYLEWKPQLYEDIEAVAMLRQIMSYLYLGMLSDLCNIVVAFM